MEKGSRPIRNRRHSRRAWPTTDDIHNQVKRLFTPEIKRMLKDWLVRRRDNPYPSREEKKTLAIKTGLTYTQICNWFANWRRKLKNAGREPQKKTWGHLIKNYNTNAYGNVEQFSICSGDSIWGDEERNKYERNLMNSNFTNYEQHQQQQSTSSMTAMQNFNNTELINYSSSKISRKNQRYLQQHKQLRNEGRCHNHKNKTMINNAQHLQQPPHRSDAQITHQIHEVPFFNPNDYIIDNTLYLPSRKSNQGIMPLTTAIVMEQNDLYHHTNYNSASTVENTNSFLYKPLDDTDNNGCFINNIQMRYNNNQRNHRIRHDDIKNGNGNDDDDDHDEDDDDDDCLDDNEDDIDGDDEDDGDEDVIGNRKTRNNNGYFTNAKYKNHIMEKYLRGLDTSASSSQQSLLLNTAIAMQKNDDNNIMMGFTETSAAAAAAAIAGSSLSTGGGGGGDGDGNNNNVPELSKWLESTANFTPIKNNYIEWDSRHKFLKNRQQNKKDGNYLEDSFNDISLHQKEELDAAEALTSLAGNYRNRIMNNLIANNNNINNNNNNIGINKLNFT